MAFFGDEPKYEGIFLVVAEVLKFRIDKRNLQCDPIFQTL